MMNLKRLLKTQLSPLPKWIPIALVIIALIGFADATYLTVEHYANVIPPCTTGGCETVLTSKYANIVGVPTSLFGSVYYLIIAVSIFLYMDTKKNIFIVLPLLLSVVGLLTSLCLVFIMAFVLKAFCPYCAVSAITSITLFVSAVIIFRKYIQPIS